MALGHWDNTGTERRQGASREACLRTCCVFHRAMATGSQRWAKGDFGSENTVFIMVSNALKFILLQQRFLNAEESLHLKSFLPPDFQTSDFLSSPSQTNKSCTQVCGSVMVMIPPKASEAFTILCLRPTEKARAVALLAIWVLLPAAHWQWDLGPVSQAPL